MRLAEGKRLEPAVDLVRRLPVCLFPLQSLVGRSAEATSVDTASMCERCGPTVGCLASAFPWLVWTGTRLRGRLQRLLVMASVGVRVSLAPSQPLTARSPFLPCLLASLGAPRPGPLLRLALCRCRLGFGRRGLPGPLHDVALPLHAAAPSIAIPDLDLWPIHPGNGMLRLSGK